MHGLYSCSGNLPWIRFAGDRDSWALQDLMYILSTIFAQMIGLLPPDSYTQRVIEFKLYTFFIFHDFLRLRYIHVGDNISEIVWWATIFLELSTAALRKIYDQHCGYDYDYYKYDYDYYEWSVYSFDFEWEFVYPSLCLLSFILSLFLV